MENIIQAQELYTVAEIELTYRNSMKPSLRPKIKSAKEAYEILLSAWDRERIEFVEQFKVVLLNTANRILGIYEMSTGGVATTIVDPRLVFAAALKANAAAMVLCHNHPSGELKPSSSDIALTSKLAEAGKLLDIRVLDHLIISPEGYYSFSDEGLL